MTVGSNNIFLTPGNRSYSGSTVKTEQKPANATEQAIKQDLKAAQDKSAGITDPIATIATALPTSAPTIASAAIQGAVSASVLAQASARLLNRPNNDMTSALATKIAREADNAIQRETQDAVKAQAQDIADTQSSNTQNTLEKLAGGINMTTEEVLPQVIAFAHANGLTKDQVKEAVRNLDPALLAFITGEEAPSTDASEPQQPQQAATRQRAEQGQSQARNVTSNNDQREIVAANAVSAGVANKTDNNDEDTNPVSVQAAFADLSPSADGLLANVASRQQDVRHRALSNPTIQRLLGTQTANTAEVAAIVQADAEPVADSPAVTALSMPSGTAASRVLNMLGDATGTPATVAAAPQSAARSILAGALNVA